MALREYQSEMVDAFYGHNWQPGSAPLGILPVGGGKTWVVAELLRQIHEEGCREQALILAHRAELLTQTAEKIRIVAPHIPVGIYSAGLGQKRIREVTVAGIQSIYRARLSGVGLVIIDECHLTSRNANSMYGKLLARLRDDNPELRVIGLTATPWRLDSGSLIEGDDRLFTEIVYDAPLRRLIDEGWLVPFVSKVGRTEADLTGVHVRGGEYVPGEAAEAMDREELIETAVEEIVELGEDRRSWLLFCAGIEHAEHVCAALVRRGVSAACVFGHTQGRANVLQAYREGRLRALVNCEVLTTGVDIPRIDLIALLRPTKSPSLYVQLTGRGSRPLPGVVDAAEDDPEARREAIARSEKPSCLFLDYTQTVRDLGPIDAVRPPRGKRRGGEKGEAPARICPSCRSVLHPTTRSCPDCGHEFPEPILKHSPVASVAPVMSNDKPEIFAVTGVAYRRHVKWKSDKSGEPVESATMRVDYRTAGIGPSVSEWVCFEHTGHARWKAERWWKHHARTSFGDVPATVDEALERQGQLKPPTGIAVRREGKFYRVVRTMFEEREIERLSPLEELGI